LHTKKLLIFLLLLATPAFAQSLQFPADDGKHDKVDFEGWTLLTHLTASDSSRYGLAIFFFAGKVIGLNASVAYVVVADETKKESRSYRKIKPPIISRATHTKGKLFEKYGKNILRRNPEGGPYEVEIDMKGLKASLKFTPGKAPVDMGQMAVGKKRNVRLYAVPRGEVTAKMQYGKKQLELKGFGLFQHQWGDSPEKDAASNMFATHFEDGEDIIVYYSAHFPSINTLVRSGKDGSISMTRNFTVTADTVFKAPGAKDQFAMRWKIKTTENSQSLRLEPTFDGQEINLLGLPYWLGRCQAESTDEETDTSGIGYVYLRLLKR
jgi:predicted secreted hydrolase